LAVAVVVHIIERVKLVVLVVAQEKTTLLLLLVRLTKVLQVVEGSLHPTPLPQVVAVLVQLVLMPLRVRLSKVVLVEQGL
tara:strand:+ start:834 stop:1073 length:240 start_codon:yes stop_codon:yes gene_type:complete